MEVEAYTTVKKTDVLKFIWKNIICIFGVPYKITTDNGTQFIGGKMAKFC